MLLIPKQLFSSDQPAVFDSATERWWTYSELVGRVRALAESLSGPRRLVFCFCRNDAATIVNYLGCLESGHPVALLNSALAVEAKTELVARYRPELLLATADEPWIPSEYRSSGSESARIWYGDPAGVPLHSDLSVLLSTSGTTGSPRFVRLSARNVRANAESIIAVLGINPADRAIACLPFHYSYGLSVLNTHLLAGASLVTTTDALTSSRFWETVRQHNCTSFAGVPYSYEILDRLKIDTLNVPSLRTMTQAGGKLNNEVISRLHEVMRRRGGRLFIMYGQTEATARIAILPPSDLPCKLGSAGLPIPGGRFQIRADNDSVAQPGVEGELIYSGPNVMMGYATCRAELADGDSLDGTLRTGDLCRLDTEGYLFVVGRMKRDAKLFGLRINLDDVEAILKVNGPTAVISARDKLIVFCEYGDPELLESLQHKLASRLNINYRSMEFHRIDKLPVQQNGKPDYVTLREMGR